MAAAHTATDARPGGGDLAARCRDAQLKLTPRRLAVIALFDAAETPIDIDEAYDRVRAAGQPMARSSLYRLISDLIEAGVVLELSSAAGRRRYVAAAKAMACRLVDPKGAALAVDTTELRALLTRLAVEAGLPVCGCATITFDADPA